MSAHPYELPAAFARLWIDSSVQMMRVTTDLWAGLLAPAQARRSSSTASPWWMPPQASGFAAAAWPPAMTLPALPSVTANPFLAWPTNVPAVANGSPFAFWQQMWLQAAAPSLPWPYQAAAAPTTPSAAVWQPFAAAYRTANGHAIAAVLRTMADVVEPKPNFLTPAQFWPAGFGTRH